jgi:hypothetical protein
MRALESVVHYHYSIRLEAHESLFISTNDVTGKNLRLLHIIGSIKSYVKKWSTTP